MLLYPYNPLTHVLPSKIPVDRCKCLVLLVFSDGLLMSLMLSSKCSGLLSVYVFAYFVLLDLFFVAIILSTFS